MNEQRKRIKRLAIWFLLNTIIFAACYLNYRLQLKHRYLYNTLNVGLCFSRAAAMVINFNLLLVWLPMCKYSLTRLAFLANNSLRHQKQCLLNHQKLMLSTSASQQPSVGQCQQQQQVITVTVNNNTNTHIIISQDQQKKSSKFSLLLSKVKSSANGAIWQLHHWFLSAKLNSISSFLIAVDHCTSLHTICATTITIASVIHTVAHLMNVINFSNNYDPLLSNLNMAEYKGQNPLQLLVSVPGITGSLMVIILILMSLSSVGFIRNSSYDLFQIFHRLSVIFVILLFLHPSSHVLKEQSNIDRHNPEICYSKMVAISAISNSTTTTILRPDLKLFASLRATGAPPRGNEEQLKSNENLQTPTINEQNENHNHHQGLQKFNSTLTRLQQYHEHYQLVNNHPLLLDNNNNSNNNNDKTNSDLNNNDNIKNDNQNATTINKRDSRKLTTVKPTTLAGSNGINSNNNNNNSHYNYPKQQLHHQHQNNKTVRREVDNAIITNNQVRTDAGDEKEVVIVAEEKEEEEEKGVSWSNRFCLDPRPLFVAQSSICWYVLSIGLSCYLVDLILRKSRRSKSSIQLLDVRSDCEGNLIELILSNNHKRFTQWLPGQFVYLNCPQIATYEWHPFTISSMDNGNGHFTLHIKTGGDWTRKLRDKLESMQNSMSPLDQKQLEYSSRQDQQQKQLTSNIMDSDRNEIFVKSKLLRLHVPELPDLDCYNKSGKLQVECTKLICIRNESERQQQEQQYDKSGDCLKVDSSQKNHHQQELYSICHNLKGDTVISRQERGSLKLYIDGPFHSPFERLLEQQVSVCIANGVGWTAFSSVFQCLTNNLVSVDGDTTNTAATKTSWWSHWRKQSGTIASETTVEDPKNLHSQESFKMNLTSFKRHTKLHLMVIVTSIEQLKPFYELALKYFNRIQNECHLSIGNQINPVREITAFLTRSTKDDQNVKEFCKQNNLTILYENHTIRVNDLFTIHFGKPKFDIYLNAFSAIYPNSKKISVYCCGSYQVKKDVREICLNLNKVNKRQFKTTENKELQPIYSYHEENF